MLVIIAADIFEYDLNPEFRTFLRLETSYSI